MVKFPFLKWNIFSIFQKKSWEKFFEAIDLPHSMSVYYTRRGDTAARGDFREAVTEDIQVKSHSNVVSQIVMFISLQALITNDSTKDLYEKEINLFFSLGVF
ncbi:MAG: hypothetical protein JXR48_14495 [Candidatus Delongbacteria bacterium]|nr:hypothetical protein [Candidatus Delongbacteria bacterium]